MQSLTLWLAQGFGVGRIPFAPGTFGSVVGLGWFLVLAATGNFWLYLSGIVLGIILSVWVCGAAERILKQKDPSSVIMDEIAAMPLCFLAWVANEWFRHGHWPALESFFNNHNWVHTAGVFGLFRFFDILKPWPVGRSQKLPGGWGVTVDDVLAAVYVCLITLPLMR